MVTGMFELENPIELIHVMLVMLVFILRELSRLDKNMQRSKVFIIFERIIFIGRIDPCHLHVVDIIEVATSSHQTE